VCETRNNGIVPGFFCLNSFYYLGYGSKYLEQVMNSAGDPIVLFSRRVVAVKSALLLKILGFRDVGEGGSGLSLTVQHSL